MHYLDTQGSMLKAFPSGTNTTSLSKFNYRFFQTFFCGKNLDFFINKPFQSPWFRRNNQSYSMKENRFFLSSKFESMQHCFQKQQHELYIKIECKMIDQISRVNQIFKLNVQKAKRNHFMLNKLQCINLFLIIGLRGFFL